MFYVFLVAMAGAFYLGNFVAADGDEVSGSTAPDILEEARRSVPEPELPPRPAGQTVTTTEIRTVKVPEPRVVFETQTFFGGIKTKVPRVETVMKEIQAEVPVTKLVDVTGEAVAAWNMKVKAIQEEYDQKIQQEVQKIAERRAAEERAELVQRAQLLTKDIIIPLISALTGLIGAIATLRWGAGSKS